MALFIGRLGRDTRPRDLEDVFYRYGKITRCDVKGTYGFIEFEDKRDAEDAIEREHGRNLLGSRIVVEWAKGNRGERSDTRRDGCFRCGKDGHWARECPEAGDDDRHGGRGYGRGGRGGYRARSRSPYRRSRSRSPVRSSRRRERSYSRSRSRSLLRFFDENSYSLSVLLED
eukprot:Sdes_comp20954_c0_seq3m18672